MTSDPIRRAGTVLGLLALLAAIFALHLLVLYPQGHVAVLYALPVLLAAWLFRPAVALGFAVPALGLHAFDSWMDDTPTLTWGAEVAAIALVAALGIRVAEQSRAHARLALENARLAEERRREAEAMPALAAEQARLARELSEARRERERFLGMVTHEIAGILTVLGGHAELMARPQGSHLEPLERSAHRILEQTRRLERLVNDLRDISRIEQGTFDIQRNECDIVALGRRVLEEQQTVATRHRLLLESKVETLPGKWDYERLAQVLSNLVRNAVNYSPGGREVVVTVGREDGHAQVSVSDQGMGIAPEDLGHLFKPYSRLRHTAELKGTGLGLYISKAIVEAHGGTIEVRSELGKGTTFTVTLPLDRDGE